MHIYIGSNSRVAAVDPRDGRLVWQTDLPVSGTVVTVLEHEGRVFAGCRGHLVALDAASGRILWSNGLEGFGYHPVSLAGSGRGVQVLPTVS